MVTWFQGRAWQSPHSNFASPTIYASVQSIYSDSILTYEIILYANFDIFVAIYHQQKFITYTDASVVGTYAQTISCYSFIVTFILKYAVYLPRNTFRRAPK